MANVSKRKLNSKIVKIKAPVLLIQQGDGHEAPVWMERDFFPNLLDKIKSYKINMTQIEFLNNIVRLKFKTAKEATKFRLVYERENT